MEIEHLSKKHSPPGVPSWLRGCLCVAALLKLSARWWSKGS